MLLRDQEVAPITAIPQTRCDICSSVLATSSIVALPFGSMLKYTLHTKVMAAKEKKSDSKYIWGQHVAFFHAFTGNIMTEQNTIDLPSPVNDYFIYCVFCFLKIRIKTSVNR